MGSIPTWVWPTGFLIFAVVVVQLLLNVASNISKAVNLLAEIARYLPSRGEAYENFDWQIGEIHNEVSRLRRKLAPTDSEIDEDFNSPI